MVEQLENSLPGGVIQITGRFICQYDVWIMHQGTGDCAALLLAAGQLRWPVTHASGQPDLGQHFFRA